jgi:hypothetical protein
MSFSNDGDGYATFEEASLASESDSVSGSAPVMNIWGESRVTKLNNLAGVDFTNNSSFSVPAGVVGATESYQTTWSNQERKHGVNASGQPLDSSGKAFPGTASIELNGEVISETSATGPFIVSSLPPAGVYFGVDTPLDAYDFRFTPEKTGLDVFTENIGVSHDAGTFRYGELAGSITDYAGDALGSETVYGEGTATKTDENGAYSFPAPGGKSVTLKALGTETTKTPSEGETITLDFQASKVVVEVVTPDLDTVAGTPVQVGDTDHTTDDEGQVVVDPAYLVEYEILVSDRYLLKIDVTSEGNLYEQRVGDGDDKAGLNARLVDAATGEPIRDLPAEFLETETLGVSNEAGRLRLFTDEPDAEDAVEIGVADNRYRTTRYSGFDLAAGETVEGRVEIERQTQISNP